jgi:hypothetical protein
VDEVGGESSANGGKRNVSRLLVENPNRKRPLGTQRPRLEGNITMDLIEVGFGGVDWVGLAQDRYSW